MRHWDAMSDEEFHPELAGYDPDEGARERRPGAHRTMRIVVIVGVALLVVPGILYTADTQVRTAQAACDIVVPAVDSEAVGADARFELAGAAGPGWYCYAQHFDGSELLVRSLGLIPGLSGRIGKAA